MKTNLTTQQRQENWFTISVIKRLGVRGWVQLTHKEFRMAAKIAGIVLMALVVLLTVISQQFPAEMFIYGRF